MSRKGNCWDNACSETLFGWLKVERLHDEHFATLREARDATLDFPLWYNHSTLGYQSPTEFEKVWHNNPRSLTAKAQPQRC